MVNNKSLPVIFLTFYVPIPPYLNQHGIHYFSHHNPIQLFFPCSFSSTNLIKNSPMASQRTQMGLAIVLMAMILGGVKAQDCTNVIISMSPCLNYIQGNSTSPSSGCCTQLASVVRSQPQCLCQVLNGGGANLGLSINQTQALELPKACNVQTPPVNQCKGKESFADHSLLNPISMDVLPVWLPY